MSENPSPAQSIPKTSRQLILAGFICISFLATIFLIFPNDAIAGNIISGAIGFIGGFLGGIAGRRLP